MAGVPGKEKLDLIYKKDQLTFRSFHVWYQYKTASQQVLDSLKDKRMTGFKLTWRVERPGFMVKNADNYPEKGSRPSHTWFIRLVQLAQYLRIKENLTGERILDKVMQGKIQNNSILAEQGICANDQIKSENINDIFPKLVPLIHPKHLEGPAIDEDILRGFDLYHLIVFCPEMDIKLHRFVGQLLSSERKRTIIQSFANLFHSGIFKGTTSITLIKAFYMDLAATLQLQYGNLLLATSTKSQLKAVRDMDGPFFTNNTDLVGTCILDSKCDRLQDVIRYSGRMFSFN